MTVLIAVRAQKSVVDLVMFQDANIKTKIKAVGAFSLASIMCAIINIWAFAPLAIAQHADIEGRELRQIKGDELRETFAGHTYYGTYKETRELTGTSTFVETTHASGRTDYKEGDMELTGLWRVFDSQLCYQYDSDKVTGLHCFAVFEIGTCLYGYNRRFVGPKGPINANFWTVKSIRKGDVSTCDDLLG